MRLQRSPNASNSRQLAACCICQRSKSNKRWNGPNGPPTVCRTGELFYATHKATKMGEKDTK